MTKEKLIDLVPRIRERAFERVLGELSSTYSQAGDVLLEYQQLMHRSPLEAIQQLDSYLERMRECQPEPGAESYAGPNPEFNVPLLNLTGTIYPVLEREERTIALQQTLNFLSGINTRYVHQHMELIQEPWLFMDILINRWSFFPGCEGYKELTRTCNTWHALRRHLPVENSFLLAFSVLHTRWDDGPGTNLPARTQFYRTFPELTDRSLDAIAALSYEAARWAEREQGTNLQTSIDHSLDYYDPEMHQKIRDKIKEHKWIMFD
ncbi:MAG: hypothetical protein WCV90_03595 [Candidatus Woesearchaeota archaeon]